jgi:NAD(P)-dependent dehydrogenase (short-subunit alcohol dehydrogenase family)
MNESHRQEQIMNVRRPGDSALVVVTGGAGDGIGRAVSAAVAERGWHVAVADRDVDAAERVAADVSLAFGVRAVGIGLDVADEASVHRVFTDVLADLPPLRGLVNSAGVGLVKRLADVSPEEWDRVHGVDLRGAYLCCRAALSHLSNNGGGAIVNIGSVQALGPHVGYSTYAAAKAGLVGLTRGIAADHGSDGIRCSIIHPGLVDSPQNREIFSAWGDPEAWIDRYVHTRQMIPRLISPAEIGAVAAFLLSDDARSITAAEITVDGGSSRMAFDREPAIRHDRQEVVS